MSCVFYRPEVAVTTFQLSLAVGGSQVGSSQLPPVPTLVKGCERRFAVEVCGTIRLCTPSYYREDGQSLIWDVQEGVIAGRPTVEERRDDAADLEEQQRINSEMARRRPLAQATGRIATTSLRVRESEQSSLTYGDNCLIWCSSIKPRNGKQWASWRASLEPSYDHISTIHNPHMFAQALGAMAFQQRSLLGDPISFRNPKTGYVAQCPSLSVVYGPVVYVDDRRAYIEESSSDLEFVIRTVFTKTSEHRHQREYRFAILTNRELEDDTLDLMVSTEMRWSVTEPQDSGTSADQALSVEFDGCLPSFRLFECFPEWPSGEFTSEAKSSFHLAGVEHKHTTKVRRAVQTVEDVDYEYLEQTIAEKSKSPSDARIVKFILDAGPGSVITLYDLGGLIGTYRLAKRSGKAVLTATVSDPDSDERVVLLDNSEFDGVSFLSGETDQLTLSYTRANPATAVQTELSDAEDTVLTITATSEDGTATSSFKIVFDSSLGINVTPTGSAPAN